MYIPSQKLAMLPKDHQNIIKENVCQVWAEKL